MKAITKHHQPSPKTPELSAKQEIAVQLLSIGKTHAEVAEELEVARETVTRWNANPFFLARLNEVKNELIDKRKLKAQTIIEDALDSLQKGVKEDPRLALQLLKQIGFFGKMKDFMESYDKYGKTDAEAIAQEWAVARANKELPQKDPFAIDFFPESTPEETRRRKLLVERKREEILREGLQEFKGE